MTYLSVCSGIEAATVAWHSLGWTPVAFSEIEAFPSAVLKHHYPSVPNWGDMTTFQEWPDATIDLLVGGTPCQSFSVAGLRAGLADPRGNLALTYLAIADKYRPEWVVWENVPGVLSSGGGRDFGAFLGGLGQLGYGFAYRVLDAQYFGLAQRRKRVFVVGYLGDWRRAAAVLFDAASLSGHPAPRREAGQRPALGLEPCLKPRGPGIDRTGDTREQDCVIPEIANPLTARMHKGINTTCDEGQTMIAHAFDASEDGTGRGMGYKDSHANGSGQVAVAFVQNQRDEVRTTREGMQVRRLTPVECERLQGFPDGYTNIPWRKAAESPDAPRYKALGNSMAVPVMRWIGERIQRVEAVV